MLRRAAFAPVLALAVAACRDDTSAPAAESFATSFDRMWIAFDRDYSYFDYKGVNWSSIRRDARGRVERVTSDEEFIALVREVLSSLKDVHVWVMTPHGGVIATYQPVHRLNWSAAIGALHRRRTGWVDESSAIGYDTIDGIPYIALSTWSAARFDVQAFDRVLERHRDAPAIILDVRMNSGGDDNRAYRVAGRFTASPRVGARYQFRNGPLHNAYTPLTERRVMPRGTWQYTKPVVLLTGRGSWSAAEGFTSAMRELPNVTVVGDTTGGGSGNPSVFPLRGGWGVSVSRWIEFTADRQVIEWRGIAPDSSVAFSDAAVAAGEDETLRYAVAFATRIRRKRAS